MLELDWNMVGARVKRDLHVNNVVLLAEEEYTNYYHYMAQPCDMDL